MSVTASKLGSAPLTLDWSHLLRVSGTKDTEELTDAWKHLSQRFAAREVGFYDSPISNEISQANESIALAQKLIQSRIFTDCLILGIGGSALGPISLLSALKERCTSGIRMHFVENPDPIDWKSTLRSLNPETTLVCIIAKSGTTFETLAQALLALEWLGKSRIRSHVVAITDPAKGDLKAYATQEGIPTLHIHPSIGGRFSIFSPVGLFPAALAGLSVNDLILGAKQVRDYCEKHALEKNPLLTLGREFIANYPKRPIHVCMPYSTRLRLIGDWFVQLWGESLGKDGKGFTPIAAVGATDQHSILQLLRDGPDDKITLFITIDKIEDEVKIPKLTSSSPLGSHALPAFRLLEGHTLHELLQVEYQAISLVLTRQNRPHLSLKLDQLDERAMGALYFAFSVMTGFTGTLWGVNPFDQPGVEEGKVYIRESLRTAPSSSPDDDGHSAVSRLRRD